MAMQVDDILDIRFAVDYAGVSTVFGMFWEVQAYRGPDADVTIMTNFATEFWDTIKAAITDTAILSCVKMINLTNPSKELVFPALAGTDLGDAHPPHQVLRVYQYGQEAAGEHQVRNSINLSGIIETLSTRGRVNDDTPFQALVTFLVTDHAGGANGADLRPKVQRTTALGGPGLPDTVDHLTVQYSRLHEKFSTLRSRKFRLCI